MKPIISGEVQDHRVVVVGREIHASKRWKTFHDFLFEYVKRVFGTDWWDAELAKPAHDRHVVVQWCIHLCDRSKVHEPGPKGLIAVAPDGLVYAYNLLAYDLFVLRHHDRLQDLLVRRLKNVDQFQGARYELFVATTLIRGGFDVDFEDETDSRTKHAELVATHPETRERFSVEAKSRHRDGVLGRPGNVTDWETVKLGVHRKLSEASEKPSVHPLVVFVDLNLPPNRIRPGEEVWRQDLCGDIKRMAMSCQTGFPFALVVVTNCPDHYGVPAEPRPDCMGYFAHFPTAVRPLQNVEEVADHIERALRLYGRVPDFFPDDERFC